jgi:RNA polymerase II subunit A small phosphatase-like protein
MQQKLLILDLDETLVYATQNVLATPADFKVAEYFVYKRPYVDKFLAKCFNHFKIAVWTSSGSNYANAVTEKIFSDRTKLQFVWSKERCTQRYDPELRDSYSVKDLKKVKKLGYPLENILVVDDSAEKLQRNFGNHIRIIPFEGDPDDSELVYLSEYLEGIKDVENVRTIDKRNRRKRH